MPKKAVLLIRVSDPRQEKEGLSLDNQEEVMRRYALEQGFEVVKEFRFQETADRKIRKRFMEVIHFVKHRKDVNAIIGYRVDRMTRNYRDHVLMDDLRLDFDKELHFVYDRLVISKKTVGRDIQDWDTKVYLAKQFLNRLKEDGRNTADFKLRNGEWPAKAPFGLKNEKRDDGRNWVFPDPVKAPIVLQMYQWYATGAYAMEGVRQKVNDEFGIALSKGMVDFILRNSFYCGEMRYDGKTYPHRYEVVVSRSLYDQVQARRKGFHKQPVRFAGLPFLYRGMIRCDTCGCAITPERKLKGGAVYHYYHCTQYHGRHSTAWVREEELTQQFLDLFKQFHVPELELRQLVTTLKQSNQSQSAFSDQLRKELRTNRDRYEQRLRVMYEDKLDGTISAEYFEEKQADYRAKQREIDQRIAQLDMAADEYFLTASSLLVMASRLPELFNRAEMDEKRTILKMLLQNCRLNEKTLLWELKKPFDTVFSHTSRSEWLPLMQAFLNREVELDCELSCVQAILNILPDLTLQPE